MLFGARDRWQGSPQPPILSAHLSIPLFPPTHPRLILHGGAGHITRVNLPPSAYALYASFLLSVNRSTRLLLEKGANSLDAATHAVALLEDNELFNCGRGAMFTREGGIELEASVMVSKGYRKRGCGVVLLKRVKNPIRLAREMLIRGEVDGGGGGNGGGGGDPAGGAGGAQGHCVLGGPTVEALAEEWGLEMVEEDYFWTKRRWEEHKRGLKGEAEGEYLPQGTVGCVALDRYGTLCVATSTGGLTNKLSGRIGDTPTIGAGFWAEEWEVYKATIHKQPQVRAPIASIFPDGVKQVLGACLPGFTGYIGLPEDECDEKSSSTTTRAIAVSGTGNGDSFLRLAAARTAGAIARFSPNRSLPSAVTQIAGPGGELQQSAGDRWGKGGEGEGGMIGIELVEGVGKVVYDFNCGGMFRCWIDDEGRERIMVFREEY